MAIDITFKTIVDTEDVAAINNNFESIGTAFQEALSREGTTPNMMDADLDLNGYGILNAGTFNKSYEVSVLTNISGTGDDITADAEGMSNLDTLKIYFLDQPPGTNNTTTPNLTINPGQVDEITYVIKSSSGGGVALGDIVENVSTMFFIDNAGDLRQIFSSATVASFDHQGEYDNGTTYTEGQVVTGSNDNWYQLKVASATGDNPVSGGSGDWLLILDASLLVPGLSDLDYTTPETGGVERTAQSKLEDLVTPEDFGAVGDAVNTGTAWTGTDDTAAILLALATKKAVHFDGSKNYLVSDLVLAGNEHIVGNGASLCAAAGSKWVLQATGWQYSVLNINLDDRFYETLKGSYIDTVVSASDTVIGVQNPENFEAGMYVIVQAAARRRWSYGKIASVDTVAGTITLNDGVIFATDTNDKYVYGGYGALRIEGNDSRWWSIRDVYIIGGAYSYQMQGDTEGASDVSRGSIRGLNCDRPRIAAEVITTDSHDNDRMDVQGWGGTTLDGTVSGDGVTTVYDIETVTGDFLIINGIVTTTQIVVRVDGVTQTEGVDYTVTQGGSGVTFTTAPGNGLDVRITVFDYMVCGVIYDARGSGTVNGAHKWVRAVYVNNYQSAYWNGGGAGASGLIHLTQCNYDAGLLYGTEIDGVNKFYATHLFTSFTPFPLIVRNMDAASRVLINGLYTDVHTGSEYIEVADTAGAVALTLDNCPVNTNDGRPNVVLNTWWGPYTDVTVGAATDRYLLGELQDAATSSQLKSENTQFVNRTTNVASGSTFFFGATESGTASNNTAWVMPVDCRITNLTGRSNAVAGSGQNYTYTVMKNGVDTALEFTISGASDTTGADTETGVSFGAGDAMQLKLVVSASAAATTHQLSFVIEPV